jgi:hypothetical protein
MIYIVNVGLEKPAFNLLERAGNIWYQIGLLLNGFVVELKDMFTRCHWKVRIRIFKLCKCQK